MQRDRGETGASASLVARGERPLCDAANAIYSLHMIKLITESPFGGYFAGMLIGTIVQLGCAQTTPAAQRCDRFKMGVAGAQRAIEMLKDECRSRPEAEQHNCEGAVTAAEAAHAAARVIYRRECT